MAGLTPTGPSGEPPARAPEPITSDHDLSTFACGRPELDRWLRVHALAGEGRTARTYVVGVGHKVVAYYCLAAGSVGRQNLVRRMRHGTPEMVPVMVLGRLATDTTYQGRGIGKGMLQEAISRSIAASLSVGMRGILVHPIDGRAAAFYLRHSFMPSPIDPNTLLLPIEIAIAALK